MCGLAGMLNPSCTWDGDKLQATAMHMAGTLCHRGPDDSGVWVDAESGVAMGHHRLSIIDLSPHGHQPMLAANGRYVIAYNGEVYNFQVLRRHLADRGHSFRGYSDTEVILEAVSEWGLVGAVSRFIGMFAFALWDRKERALHLVRDRLGIKPLFYGWASNTFLFGSELKAIRIHPAFEVELSRAAIALLLRHGRIPAPYSIYEDVFKLPPGTRLTIRSNSPSAKPSPIPYWSARDVAERGIGDPFRGSVDEAVEELDALLRDAVKQRLVSDVPLGALLSGGVDSSTVVALMQSQSDKAIKTFSIGFHESGYDEADDARRVARHLGTDHTELYVTAEEATSVIPSLPSIYDEPFADSSQIPTLLVSQFARRDVKVVLSGDGGDELFCGYDIYAVGRRIWGKIGWMPRPVREALATTLSLVPEGLLDRGPAWLSRPLDSYGRDGTLGDKIRKFAEVLMIDRPEAIYLRLTSHWKDPDSVVAAVNELPGVLNEVIDWRDLPDLVTQMMYMDTITYLPDDILTKVDRASMSEGLEVRVPILDHRVVEFAWRLPLSMKLRSGQGKWVLRQVLRNYVPQELFERPKGGFSVPMDTWLRGPLQDWAGELLDERRLRQEGFFNPEPIRAKWSEHMAGTQDWGPYLWDVLMFQAWLESEQQRTRAIHRT